ncbi:hypothetical protein [Halopiger djelfimassiliensis]|uniref:hypothetical protein n=1 Tax=Halopiger djelfimassiliensis TaxID=1293047 RepID=UPI000677AA9E|nr:hypothetical protein [Halopiger djelfimassiliensis]
MEATITATGRQADIVVLDNRDRKHTITLEGDGTIYAHETSAYPSDPADRTPAENELVRQARRFARYTLANEEGELLALPLVEHPDLLLTSYQLIDHLSRERFDELFRDIALQFASHTSDEITPITPLPRTVDEDDFVFYRVDLWMGPSEDFSMQAYNSYLESVDLGMVEGSLNALFSGNQLNVGIEYIKNIGKTAATEGSEPLDLLSFHARSTIRPVVVKPDGTVIEPPAGAPINEPPTARIELPPFDPGTRREFQEFLAYHFLCRARDTYLGMGLEPPREEVKVRGPGIHEYTQRYRTLDVYESYHDPDAEISTWSPREITRE